MSLSDPIADMLTRIRNAARSGKRKVTAPGSRIKSSILEIMEKEGFIEEYKEVQNNNKSDLEIFLKYSDKKPVIKELERVSRPGRRYYVKAEDLRPVRNNMGIAIVSTSHGVMTGRKAKSMNLGGEILCRIW